MALYRFTKALFDGEPLTVYNEGRMVRDFTYVDDIVEGVVRVVDRPATPDPAWRPEAPAPGSSRVPWRIYNIGNSERVELMRYIRAIEAAAGRRAVLQMLPMQPGDVEATEADVSALDAAVGFKPAMPVEEGVRRFVEWYRDYHGVAR